MQVFDSHSEEMLSTCTDSTTTITHSSVVSEPMEMPQSDSNMWISSLGLLKSDHIVLENHQWLNDNIIFASQQLLKHTFDIHGLQSPLLGTKFTFKVLPWNFKYLQILHIKGNHWILVSNIDVNSGRSSSSRVMIYDSLLSEDIDSNTMQQVCSFLRPTSKDIRVDIMNIMKQTNKFDCGLFCIANMTELAYGYNPVKVIWNVKKMRSHLSTCLKNGKLQRFPILKERRIPFGKAITFTTKIDIFCDCRMPYNSDIDDMIECVACSGWFHNVCVNIANVSEYRSKKWLCKKCKPLFGDYYANKKQ